ncbi:GAF domain-containing protein, partial [Candidatus Symbiopectobacterium sp. NZEC135]|uniref:GAF domain-containing protein n=1 Tax=Candidatus Symbiopectobacterium sp. NZEC135 TaxID=2820471 RepID=UPI002225E88B
MRLERKRGVTDMLSPLETPLSFSCKLGECRSELMPLLSEVSKVVSTEGDLSKTLKLVLQLMQKHMQVIRAMITLYDTSSDRIYIHESYGLSPQEVEKGVYLPGEGITGQVIETRQPVIVPHVADDPLFLNKTGSLDKTRDGAFSFICVPIIRSSKVMGTIGIERVYHNHQLRYLDLEVLKVIAAIIAQGV